MRDLVPILSFAALRGRARCCAAPIDRLHPIAELAGAAIGLIAVIVAPPAEAMAGAVFGWLVLALALLDARHFWLPDRLTAPLVLLGIVAGVAGLSPALADRLIGGLLGFIAFSAIRYGYRAVRHREGMGGGDAKLFAAIGLWLGWRGLPMVLLLASGGALLFVAILAARGKAVTASSQLPFGVFLAIGGWFGWIASQ